MERIQILKHTIFNAIINGAKSVINKEKILNEINVFPVKDADTGSNLRSMMDAIVYKSSIQPSLRQTLESVSNAALIGSKGNSGLIFSQFIYGLSKDIEEDTMNLNSLRAQIKKGYEEAYKAIDHPVEGTMITLMREFYQLLHENKDTNSNIEHLLVDISKKLEIALEETKNQLPVLKKNNVIDSGALAFYTFVDGFLKTIIDDKYKVTEENVSRITELENHMFESHDHEMIEFRYCTEVLIESNEEKEHIKSLLNGLGDSLVIGRSNQYYKIHMHTNEPHMMVNQLSTLGNIIDSKVDDMKNQYMIKNEKKYDICVLTDSIGDIEQALLDEYQIQVYPVEIHVNGTKYYDKKTINNQSVLELIEKNETFPTSSSPSQAMVINQLNILKTIYKKIIIITVSSKMSSTYQVFKNAVNEMNSNDIVLIDSKQNSISQGLITFLTAKMIAEHQSFESIVKKTNEAVSNATILVKLTTLDHMVRSGRITKNLAGIAKLIHLKPIVSIDQNGEGIVLKKVIGEKNSFNSIIKHMKKIHKKEGIMAYAITYVDDIKKAEILKTKLVETLGFLPEYMTESSTVIAMNAGRQAIAVGYIKGERK